MRNPFKISLLALCGVLIGTVTSAFAQRQIDLGSDEQVYQVLRSQGYSTPKITKRSLTIIRTEACKDGKKYQVKVSILGRITSRSVIGSCQPRLRQAAFSERQARKALSDRRYTNIETRTIRGGTQAIGCRDGRRLEIVFNRRGGVVSRNDIGPCIRDTRRNDRNDRVFSSREITGLLNQRGYNDVQVTRRNSLPYLATACRNNDKYEVAIGRRGRIRGEQRIGRCINPFSEFEMSSSIKKSGYLVLKLDKTRNGWASQECRRNNKVLVSYDAYGRQTNLRQDGSCRSETVLNVLRTLENRGARNVQAYVEGCFDGGKYRWSFDRLGNRTGRSRVGSC